MMQIPPGSFFSVFPKTAILEKTHGFHGLAVIVGGCDMHTRSDYAGRRRIAAIAWGTSISFFHSRGCCASEGANAEIEDRLTAAVRREISSGNYNRSANANLVALTKYVA